MKINKINGNINFSNPSWVLRPQPLKDPLFYETLRQTETDVEPLSNKGVFQFWDSTTNPETNFGIDTQRVSSLSSFSEIL